MALLEVSGISKRFDSTEVLKDISLELEKGEAIAIIGRRGFNLRCLKSHPTGEENWAYYFYVEGDGNLGSEAGRQMLEELKSVCSSVRLMGSFGRERVLREEPEGKE